MEKREALNIETINAKSHVSMIRDELSGEREEAEHVETVPW